MAFTLDGGGIVQVPCRTCGAAVSRMTGLAGQPPNWQDRVVCAGCRDEDPQQAWDAELDRQARARLHRRIVGFDATAGYETASLNTDDVRNTRWARAAVSALDDAAARTTRAGLMFFGPTGIGKTWAGFAICNAAVQRFGADSVRFATEETLLGGDVAPWELHGRLQSWLRGASVVLVDDIGVANRRQEQVQAAWKELCSQIAGHPSSLVLVGTTNRQGWDGDAGLTAWMGAQATSRLRQWSVDCSTGWADRRTDAVHERWREHLTGRPER